MADLLKDPGLAEEAALGSAALNDSPLEASDKTPHGNDPRLEMHFPTELDPARAVPENGYPYLDRIQREQSEIRRAAVEDREPDLDNPGPDAGNPLRSAAELNNPMNVVQSGVAAYAEPALVLDEDVLPDEPSSLGEIRDPNHLTPKAENTEPADDRQDEATEEAKEEQENDGNSSNGTGGSGDSGASDSDNQASVDENSDNGSTPEFKLP